MIMSIVKQLISRLSDYRLGWEQTCQSVKFLGKGDYWILVLRTIDFVGR